MKVCPRCGKRYSENEIRCLEDGTTLAQLSEDPFIGYQLGKYLIKEKIGKGGFGLVYLAEHLELKTPWAVKILRKQFISDQQLVKRFQREARVASQIDSDHVVKIVDTGFDEFIGFYYIMEYLKGTSLSEVMRFYPTGMPLERLLPILEQISSALDAAHQFKIVHRDLKPSNIILLEKRGKRDFVKVLDFGIAKVLQENENLTATGQIVGSPRFMSPEQAQGLHQEVDPRSDIYSLGVILFWMLTGRLPFESRQLARLLFMHIKTPPPKLNSIRTAPHFTPALEDIIASALAKRKEDRPQTATELYRRVFDSCSPFLSTPSTESDPLQKTSIQPPPPTTTTTTTISDTPDNISVSADLFSQVEAREFSPQHLSSEEGDFPQKQPDLKIAAPENTGEDELDKTRVDASSKSSESYLSAQYSHHNSTSTDGYLSGYSGDNLSNSVEKVASPYPIHEPNSISSYKDIKNDTTSSSQDSLNYWSNSAFQENLTSQVESDSESEKTLVTPSHLQRRELYSTEKKQKILQKNKNFLKDLHGGEYREERKKISIFLAILVAILLIEVVFILIKIFIFK